MSDLDFSGKIALVIGGSSGIGNGIARALLDHGAEVHVIGTRSSAEDYSAEDGSNLSNLEYHPLDVTDDAAVAAWKAPFERLDVLVQSQGLVRYRRAEYQLPDFRTVMDVNLVSVMSCAMRFHDMLAASAGAMVVISSVAAFLAARGNPAYNASKAAVNGLVRHFGQSWACDGIRVNAVAPGLVDTKLTRVTTGHSGRLDATLGRIPLGRLGTTQEIANTVLFLSSPLSSYMVGQTLIVDGGRLL